MQVPYIVKEITGYCFISVIPIATTLPLIYFMGIWWGLLGLFIGIIVSILLGILLMRNEFTPLLRGKGILTIDMNSTGILRPFVVNVYPPFIKAKLNNGIVSDVFDRKAVYNFVVPHNTKQKKESIASKIFNWVTKKQPDLKDGSGAFLDKETGDLYMKLNSEDYQKSRFGYRQYPCLIWNSQVNSFLTKDFLSTQEKEAFAEHAILNQNKLLEELNRMVFHFCRTSIDLLNPNKGMLMKNIFWIILIIGILVIGIFFVPKIIEMFSGGVGGVVSNAGQAVTPR